MCLCEAVKGAWAKGRPVLGGMGFSEERDVVNPCVCSSCRHFQLQTFLTGTACPRWVCSSEKALPVNQMPPVVLLCLCETTCVLPFYDTFTHRVLNIRMVCYQNPGLQMFTKDDRFGEDMCSANLWIYGILQSISVHLLLSVFNWHVCVKWVLRDVFGYIVNAHWRN